MLKRSPWQECTSTPNSNIVFILILLLKSFICWRKRLFFVCLGFLVPTFILSHRLLKARVEEPSLSPLCSDKKLQLTHLLLN